MNTLERLKELVDSEERREGETLAEWHDRHLAENEEVREVLPDLLEVAEAAKGIEVSPATMRLHRALAKLEEGGRADEAS